jgi:hypothetical protein
VQPAVRCQGRSADLGYHAAITRLGQYDLARTVEALARAKRSRMGQALKPADRLLGSVALVLVLSR